MSARLADGRNFEDREGNKLLDPALIRNFSCLKGQKPWRGLNRPDDAILEASSMISVPESTPLVKGTLATRTLAACLAGPDRYLNNTLRHASFVRSPVSRFDTQYGAIIP